MIEYHVHEDVRGEHEILLILRGDKNLGECIGSLVMYSYEEKVAWLKMLKELNSTLANSSTESGKITP